MPGSLKVGKRQLNWGVEVSHTWFQMSAWKVHAARITLFPLLGAGSIPKSALELYKAVWAKDPDSFQSQPAAGAPFPVSVAQGTNGAITRICQTQPVRVDLSFAPVAKPSGEVEIAYFEHAPNLRTEMTTAIGSLEKALDELPVNRVAVYFQIGQETDGYRSANKLVAGTLWEGHQVPLAEDEDFILQLNPALATSYDGMQVRCNYITKWAVERVQVFTFMGQAAGAQSISGMPMFKELIIPSVSFDNSNVPLQRALTTDEARQMLTDFLGRVSEQLKQCKISIEGF